MTAFTVLWTDGALSTGISDPVVADRVVHLPVDVAGTSDGVGKKTSLLSGFDKTGLTDPPPTKTVVQPKTVTPPPDVAGLIDGTARFDYLDTDTDPSGPYDSISFNRTMVITDPVGTTDSKIIDRAIVFNELLGVDDFQGDTANGSFFVRSDVIFIYDDIVIVAATGAQDTAGMFDTITRDFIPGASTDLAPMTDNIGFDYGPEADDTMGLTDDVTLFYVPNTGSTTDYAGLIDDVFILDRSMIITDSVGVADAASAGTPKYRFDVGVTLGL